jgi:hypothetical protein
LNWFDSDGLNRTARRVNSQRESFGNPNGVPVLRNDYSTRRESQQSAREFLERYQSNQNALNQRTLEQLENIYSDLHRELNENLPDPYDGIDKESLRQILDKLRDDLERRKNDAKNNSLQCDKNY